MTYTLDLPIEITNALRSQAASAGVPESDLLQRIVQQHLEMLARWTKEAEDTKPTTPPSWLAEIQPASPPTDGTNGLHRILGMWPGEETDEEIQTALEKLS